MRQDTRSQLQDIPGMAGLGKQELAALARAAVPAGEMSVPAGAVRSATVDIASPAGVQ